MENFRYVRQFFKLFMVFFLIPFVCYAGNESKISPEKLLQNLEKRKYTGKKIDIRFRNRDLIEAVSEVLVHSEITFTVDDDIKGKVNLIMMDIPWDQVLAHIMDRYNLHLCIVKNKLKVQAIILPEKYQKKSTGRKLFAKPSKKYRGELGDFIFHNADLQNVIIFFARTYGFNVVIDPGITGKVTCRLIQVPWDQALEVILIQNRLAMVWEGKVIQIKRF